MLHRFAGIPKNREYNNSKSIMLFGSSISILFFYITILSPLDTAAFGLTVSASSVIAADTHTGTTLLKMGRAPADPER